jgi:CubicO group peptidase (beta-lactamase class C family)
VNPSTKAVSVYFPPAQTDAWESESVASLGWNTGAVDGLYRFLEARNTTGFVVLHGGRIVLERYWQAATPRATGDVFSAQKSLTSILIGIGQADGLLGIADPVSAYAGVGWSRAPAGAEAKITVRHLLTMTSGLTTAFEFEADAGTLWFYNTPAYHVLKTVLERASGRDLAAYTRERVWDPIGDRDSAWQARAAGGLTGWMASPRDMARFGLLIVRAGSWAGTPVVEKGYLSDALSPSQDLNRAYGYLWWLNGRESFVLPGQGRSGNGPLIPPAPADVVAALGAADKKIYVCPSKDLVVARYGASAGGTQSEALSSFDSQLWERLTAVTG